MRSRSLLLLATLAFASVGCRQILGIDDDLPILSGSTGTSASSQGTGAGSQGGGGMSSGGFGGGGGRSSGGCDGGGGFDPNYGRFRIPPDSPPDSNYVINGAEVLDKTTGLSWKRTPSASEDENLVASSCAAVGQGFRVPNRVELQTILDFSKVHTKADTTAFAFGSETGFWTSSVVATEQQKAHWVVEFADIEIEATPDDQFPYPVRCVRTASSCPTPALHFKTHEDFIVDQWTGLTWARSGDLMQLADATSYCAALSVKGSYAKGWRLPMVKELLSVWSDEVATSPFWDRDFELQGVATLFWTQTAEVNAEDSIYAVDFGNMAQPSPGTLASNNQAAALCIHD